MLLGGSRTFEGGTNERNLGHWSRHALEGNIETLACSSLSLFLFLAHLEVVAPVPLALTMLYRAISGSKQTKQWNNTSETMNQNKPFLL
jgi:hypothetical protein